MGGSLPHARGGVSAGHPATRLPGASSPRPWGCFRGQGRAHDEPRVFPTPVGVFPTAAELLRRAAGLPHARGGVSSILAVYRMWASSSPRPWGCFPGYAERGRFVPVFPTPVGVFPDHCHLGYLRPGLPHARGGVSQHHPENDTMTASSPRPWGCFHGPPQAHRRRDVFPTPVGVFPARFLPPTSGTCLPHARGGVS